MEHIPGFSEIEFRIQVKRKKKLISDEAMLTTILQNLIDNSIKYRNPEAKKTLISITTEEGKGGVQIVLQDNGTGMNEEIQKNIFVMFYRGTTLSKGSGLGLYLTKISVEKLGGNISVESKPGEGALFRIYLPNAS